MSYSNGRATITLERSQSNMEVSDYEDAKETPTEIEELLNNNNNNKNNSNNNNNNDNNNNSSDNESKQSHAEDLKQENYRLMMAAMERMKKSLMKELYEFKECPKHKKKKDRRNKNGDENGEENGAEDYQENGDSNGSGSDDDGGKGGKRDEKSNADIYNMLVEVKESTKVIPAMQRELQDAKRHNEQTIARFREVLRENNEILLREFRDLLNNVFASMTESLKKFHGEREKENADREKEKKDGAKKEEEKSYDVVKHLLNEIINVQESLTNVCQDINNTMLNKLGDGTHKLGDAKHKSGDVTHKSNNTGNVEEVPKAINGDDACCKSCNVTKTSDKTSAADRQIRSSFRLSQRISDSTRKNRDGAASPAFGKSRDGAASPAFGKSRDGAASPLLQSRPRSKEVPTTTTSGTSISHTYRKAKEEAIAATSSTAKRKTLTGTARPGNPTPAAAKQHWEGNLRSSLRGPSTGKQWKY